MQYITTVTTTARDDRLYTSEVRDACAVLEIIPLSGPYLLLLLLLLL